MGSLRDLVILGGGAAGTGAALEARAHGLDVVLVEARVRSAREQSLVALADELAIRPLRRAPPERRPDGFRHAVRRAGEAASAFLDQRDQLLARRGVARLIGRASLPGDEGVVEVEHEGTRDVIRARHVLIASGSRPASVPGAAGARVEGDDRTRILDDLPPASACVIGGGRHGVLLASLMACAGAETWLVEAKDRLLPRADADVSSAIQRALEHSGVVLSTGTRVSAAIRQDSGWSVSGVMGAPVFEKLFVVAGRRPDLAAFGARVAEAVQPPLPEQSHQTAWPWLRVAGEATGRSLSAEAARRDGRAAVRGLLGRPDHVPLGDVPSLVGGSGACGWAGLSEEEASSRGHSVLIGRSRLSGRGAQLPGFVKIVADRGSRRLLGIHVVGPGREAVALGAALIELGVGLDELASMAFPVGTAAEALVEAAGSAAA